MGRFTISLWNVRRFVSMVKIVMVNVNHLQKKSTLWKLNYLSGCWKEVILTSSFLKLLIGICILCRCGIQEAHLSRALSVTSLARFSPIVIFCPFDFVLHVLQYGSSITPFSIQQAPAHTASPGYLAPPPALGHPTPRYSAAGLQAHKPFSKSTDYLYFAISTFFTKIGLI